MTRYIRRAGPVILMRLTEYEVTLLESLVEQLAGLLEADAEPPTEADSFARWQAELSNDDPLDRTDPVIRRLFPDAHPGDPAASSEFRRLTQARQRSDRLGQAEVVLSALRDSDAGKHPVQVRVIELDTWLKTVTAVRLSLAVRLGIETAADVEEWEQLPPEDPRSYLYEVYDWLSGVSEHLLALR